MLKLLGNNVGLKKWKVMGLSNLRDFYGKISDVFHLKQIYMVPRIMARSSKFYGKCEGP